LDLKNKKILVIGGAGFIGSHVVDLLLEENVSEVTIYDNFCRGTKENLKEALEDKNRCSIFDIGGDIIQTDILNKAIYYSDGVIHLAALWLLQCQDYPRSAFDVNIRGTFNVLESCVDQNIERLIYSSSASVYGDAVEIPMTEDHPYNNWTFYGATKIAGEHMFKAFHRRYGLEGVGLRYMNVYGPRQDFKGAYTSVIMKAIDNILADKSPIVFGNGCQSFDFIDVRDVARANIYALKSDIPFGFYNVGSGIKTSIKEVVELLLDLTNSNLDIEYREVGQEFVTNRVCDTSLAKKDLNFEYLTSLREGLRTLVDWRMNLGKNSTVKEVAQSDH